ncbi:MAG: VOC family protein [Betaproteobacteria bacterium]|nr:MAG: VOC family protein [Betaproteobacteria bacterium]
MFVVDYPRDHLACRGSERAAVVMRRMWIALLVFAVPMSACMARAGVIEIERIAVTVSDLGRTEAFYRDGLGFRTLARQSFDDPAMQRLLGVKKAADTMTMQLGRERVEFIRYQLPGRDYPADSRSPDLWFQHFAVVVGDMDAAYAKLQQVPFKPVSVGGPQTLPEQDGRVRAFKFRDPDGHPVELLYFPPGQGRKSWSAAPPGKIDLGIDHTAISVSDSTASIAFYGKLLGMTVAYEVVNQGPAQERLDGTVGAKVRITGLRPSSPDGLGIELLDYRAPATGRQLPADSRGDDAWHAHVVLRVDGLDGLVADLERAGVRFVSPGIVRLANGRRAIEIVDPDGHALVVEE